MALATRLGRGAAACHRPRAIGRAASVEVVSPRSLIIDCASPPLSRAQRTEPAAASGGKLGKLACLALCLLALPSAAACPAPYTAAGGGCYTVPPEMVPQWQCDALCGADGALACIGSEAENNATVRVVRDFLSARGLTISSLGNSVWIGLYQRTVST